MLCFFSHFRSLCSALNASSMPMPSIHPSYAHPTHPSHAIPPKTSPLLFLDIVCMYIAKKKQIQQRHRQCFKEEVSATCTSFCFSKDGYMQSASPQTGHSDYVYMSYALESRGSRMRGRRPSQSAQQIANPPRIRGEEKKEFMQKRKEKPEGEAIAELSIVPNNSHHRLLTPISPAFVTHAPSSFRPA